jgi:hypothetical protein
VENTVLLSVLVQTLPVCHTGRGFKPSWNRTEDLDVKVCQEPSSQSRALRRTANLDAVAAVIGRADVGALWVGDGPTLMSGRAEITAMVARLRLPAMYGFREFADAGDLISYGYSLPDAYRQSPGS